MKLGKLGDQQDHAKAGITSRPGVRKKARRGKHKRERSIAKQTIAQTGEEPQPTYNKFAGWWS